MVSKKAGKTYNRRICAREYIEAMKTAMKQNPNITKNALPGANLPSNSATPSVYLLKSGTDLSGNFNRNGIKTKPIMAAVKPYTAIRKA